MWFREYVFNVMIQPFHLLIYTVLVGSAMTLVTENLIYGIVAIGFLIPAEKLLRKFFGFDNAGTLSAAGSFAGGAVFSAMINKLNRPKPGRGGHGGEDASGASRGIRKASSDRVDADTVLTGGNGAPKPGVEVRNVDNMYRDEEAGRQQDSMKLQAQLQALGEGADFEMDQLENKEAKRQQDAMRMRAQLQAVSEGSELGIDKNQGTGVGTGVGMGSGAGTNIGTGGDSGPDSSVDSDSDADSGLSAVQKENSNAWKENLGPSWSSTWKDIKSGFKEGQGIHRLDAVGHTVGSVLSRSTDAADALSYRYKRKLVNGIKNTPKSIGRWTRKAVLGGIAGGALGLTGAAVGIASGDAGKALQYATAAGVAGYYGANYYGDKLAKEAGAAAKDASVAFWGEDYGKRQQYLYDKKYKTDPENMKVLQKYLGADGAREAMNTQVQAFLNAGVTDPKAIGKALQLMNSGKNRRFFGHNSDEALKKAVALTVWNRDAGKGIYNKNSRAYQVFKEQTIEEILENNPELTEEDKPNVEKQVDEIIEYLAQIELARQ